MTTPDLDGRIDRFMNRKLHPAAERALAHEALDDADLFEELTAVALVQAALESPATTDRALAQSALDDQDLFDTLVARGAVEAAVRVPNRRWHRTMVVAGVAAVAAGLLTFLVLRPLASVATPLRKRALVTKPPCLRQFSSRAISSRRFRHSVFRGADTASRPPKSDGMSFRSRTASRP